MRTLALEAIQYRNRFYYHNYRQMLVVIGLIGVIGLELAGFIYLKLAERGQPIYLPTTADGRPLKAIPLDENLLTNEQVMNWAIDASQAIYELDFINYARSLEDLRTNFTEKGYEDFLNALKQSNNLSAIKAKKQVVSAELNGAPTPVQNGDYKGRRAWRLKIPLKVDYQNANNDRLPQTVLVNLLIVRMDTLETPRGIAIHQYIEESSL